ncbi:MAG: hypothetical protein KY461_02080 [Actinobacteria bacterium]|nr:hypothetical protein [Actinomycetota bacterium]
MAGLAALTLTAMAPTAPDADLPAGHPEGSELLADGAVAIPLRADSPDWLTPELRQRASSAAERGMGVDIETGEFVSAAAASQFLFIRPGTWMVSPAWCTMAFVTGSPGSYSITTAGHCFDGRSEVIVFTAPSLIFAIGTGNGHAGGVGNDHGSVKIDPQFQGYVDADTAVIGGPGPAAGCGDSSVVATITDPVAVKHFGHGVVVGSGGTPRAGVSTHANHRDPFLEGGFSDSAVYWSGAATPGDSGSPVMAAATPECPLGEALAILTHLVVVGPNVQYIAGTPVSKIKTPAVGNGSPL